MNTSELEARLAGLLAKAPEEWSIVEYGDGDSLAIHFDDENRVCFMATHGGSRTVWERIQAHADLIAEGKNALPTLLQSLSTLRQRIEALEADNARLREALKRCATIVDRNLYRQHEKVEDVPKIARQALGEGKP